MNEVRTGTLILSYIVRFLGIFLVLFSLMAVYLGFTALTSISQNGTVGYSVVLTGSKDAVLVTNVEKDLPAYNAGIQPGDTIVKVNGKNITEDIFNTEIIGGKTTGTKENIT